MKTLKNEKEGSWRDIRWDRVTESQLKKAQKCVFSCAIKSMLKLSSSIDEEQLSVDDFNLRIENICRTVTFC